MTRIKQGILIILATLLVRWTWEDAYPALSHWLTHDGPENALRAFSLWLNQPAVEAAATTILTVLIIAMLLAVIAVIVWGSSRFQDWLSQRHPLLAAAIYPW